MSTEEYVQLTGFPVLPGRPGAPTGPGDPCIGINQVSYNLLFLLFQQNNSLLRSRFYGCHATIQIIWGALRDSSSNNNFAITQVNYKP